MRWTVTLLVLVFAGPVLAQTEVEERVSDLERENSELRRDLETIQRQLFEFLESGERKTARMQTVGASSRTSTESRSGSGPRAACFQNPSSPTCRLERMSVATSISSIETQRGRIARSASTGSSR